VISIGSVASHLDGGHSLFEDEGTVVAAVILYVDDLLIIANECFIEQIKDPMKKRFRKHDLGIVSLHLSMNMECNLEHHSIDTHHDSYIRTIFAKFRMHESR